MKLCDVKWRLRPDEVREISFIRETTPLAGCAITADVGWTIQQPLLAKCIAARPVLARSSCSTALPRGVCESGQLQRVVLWLSAARK